MDRLSAVKAFRSARRIQGWFSCEAALLLAWIDTIQKSNGITGDVFEIGVHHGRSAVFLASLIDPGTERLGVCDLFADQGRNLSESGLGDRAVFERNLERCVGPRVRPRVFSMRSADLSPAATGERHRIVHVDGGHSVEEALGDLRFAARVSAPGGVTVVDDPLTPVWPGVAEALFRFLEAEPSSCAVMAAFNKMVLTSREFAPLYERAFDSDEQRIRLGLGYPWHRKVVTFMNRPMRVLYVPTSVRPRSLRTRLTRYYEQNRWLSPVVSVARALGIR